MKKARFSWIVSTILLLLGLVLWLCYGPVLSTEQRVKGGASGGDADRRFNLTHLRQDLKEYPGLLGASLDSYSQNTEPANGTENKYGTYTVPGLKSLKTLDTASSDLNTSKVIESKFMTPQGVTVTPEYVITSAYDHQQRGASVLTISNRQTGAFVKTVVLQGRPHVGGVAYDPVNQLIWICGKTDGKASIIAVSIKDIKKYKLNTQKSAIRYTYVTGLTSVARASTIAYHDGELWIGFFNAIGNSTVQRFKVKDVIDKKIKQRQDYMTSGPFDNLVGGGKNQTTIGKIQGISFYKNYVYLSQSYGPEDSHIYVYDLNGKQTLFTKQDAKAVITMPSHLEQITIDQNRMYTIFESSARAYAKHEQTRIGRVVSFNVDKLKPFDVSHETK